MPLRLIALLLVFITLHPLVAQQTATDRVRAAIDLVPIGGEMTIKARDGRELHGNLSAVDAEAFTIREVDLERALVLRYDEVERVTKGYGRKGFAGRRVSPRRRLIAGVILLGGLAALIGVVAASKD
ncbi:MAG: hypothetical protein M3N54_16540 [Acidobacteriota bacterium]|nr:hypothetical protein [Acidobacteriota bacterium]